MVLQKLSQASVTLNKKCEFSKSSWKYLGQVISNKGIIADPNKVSFITNMDSPTDVSGVRRLLEMINQLQKFLPNLATKLFTFRENCYVLLTLYPMRLFLYRNYRK